MPQVIPQVMTVNGVDLSTFNLWVEVPRGWADAPQRQDRLAEIQGAGQAVIPSASRIGEKRWEVEGVVIAPDGLQSTARASWDQIKQHLSSPWLEVMISPWTDRVCICRYQEMAWAGTSLDLAGFRVRLTFMAASAYLVSPTVDTYGLTAGVEQPIALGSAPAPFLIDLIGPATGPTLSYYDANGQLRGSFRMLTDLTTGEWFRFDSQTYVMEYHTSGGQVRNGAPFLSNDSRLFQLDPADGVPERGPVLLLDSGTALALIRKAYL